MVRRQVKRRENEIVIGTDTTNYFKTTHAENFKNVSPQAEKVNTAELRRKNNVSQLQFGNSNETYFYKKNEFTEAQNV